MYTAGRVPLAVARLDPGKAANADPNRVRVTTPGGAPATTAGTILLRYSITNNTGLPITRLRFRARSLTTLNSPGYSPGTTQADLRLLTSSDAAAPINGIPVYGTTLEAPSTNPPGGGINASVNAGVVTLSAPLAPGATQAYNFKFGVARGGSFGFSLNVEAVTGG